MNLGIINSFEYAMELFKNPSVSEDFVIGNLINHIVVASLSSSLTAFEVSTIFFIITEEQNPPSGRIFLTEALRRAED
jgi:hypothetical protein